MTSPETRSPQPPRGDKPPVGPDGLADVTDVVAAFSALESQNSTVLKQVAENFGIGVIDVRAIAFISQARSVTPKQTAERLELSTGATTSLIDRMVGAGYVRRLPHPTDRRSVLLELAAAGQDAVDDIFDFYRRAFREAIDPHYLDFLATTFRSIADSLGATAAHDIGDGSLREPTSAA